MLFDPSLAEGLSLLKASQEKACFFSSGKIYSSWPGCPDAGGAAPPIGHHLLGLWTLLGLAVSFSWPGPLTPLQRLPPPRLTASCVLRVRTTKFMVYAHTLPQLHVSLSALQFLEIQDIKYNQTQGRTAKRVFIFKLSKYFLIYYS